MEQVETTTPQQLPSLPSPSPTTTTLPPPPPTSSSSPPPQELYKFEFDFNKLEITVNEVTIALVGTYNEPWFPAKELCMILGYNDPEKALVDYVNTVHKTTLVELKEVKTIPIFFCWPFPEELSTTEEKAVYITEQGVYQLTMKCKCPIGEEFSTWLTDEVIPKIRRMGLHILHKQLADQEEQIAKQGEQLAILDERILELQVKGAMIPQSNENVHIFQLYKHRENPNQYLFVRRHPKSLSKTMSAETTKQYDIVLNQVDVPNSMNVLHNLKDKLVELKISFRSNYKNTLTVLDHHHHDDDDGDVDGNDNIDIVNMICDLIEETRFDLD
jgi:prophage antirepressor-like protein